MQDMKIYTGPITQEELKRGIVDRSVVILGTVSDLRRDAGSTHWEIWDYLNTIAPITKAEFDEACREWEEDYPF